MQYITKYSISLQYAGPEEGGSWYDQRYPEWKYGIPFPSWINKMEGNKYLWWLEDLPFRLCRYLNGKEHKRRDRENEYRYTDVLSYRDEFYTYGHSDTFRTRPQPEGRPHYE